MFGDRVSKAFMSLVSNKNGKKFECYDQPVRLSESRCFTEEK